MNCWNEREMKTKIHIIHGYAATPKSHWFPWLCNKLADKNIDYIIYALPNTNNPTKNEWISYLNENISDLNENSIIVAHSLGCITSLLYLQKKGVKIKGIILVAGFIDRSPMRMFSDFMVEPLDSELIKTLVNQRIAITAKDDYLVPKRYGKIIKERLDATLIELDEGKHFLDIDGCFELPAVMTEIKKLI